LEKIGAPVEFELDTQACRLALRASQKRHTGFIAGQM
jgi:hypothetical protein